MRLILSLFAFLFILAGILFGALNPELVEYDLLVVRPALPKGAVVLGAFIAGWLLGGLLVWLLGVQPARRRLRRTQRRPGLPATGADRPDSHAS